MISESILRELKDKKIAYKTDYDLKQASTFRIGGRCELAVMPKDESQLADALGLLDACGIRTHIAGKGSNTLFADGSIDIALVITSALDGETVEGTRVTAGTGTSLIRLSRLAADSEFTGLEFAYGIPGGLGGAIYMNAGAYGGAMSDVVRVSRAYDRESGRIISVSDHGFGYRESVYKHNKSLVCLSATLELSRGDGNSINAKMKEHMDSRRAKQPLEYPSVGSYFKRPEGDFAGRLIELSGLKGERVGDAQVSSKHAGFIVNLGNATFEDVVRLEEKVREKVLADFGVCLEREVEIIK